MNDYRDYDYIIVCEECEKEAREIYSDAPDDYVVVCTRHAHYMCEFKTHEEEVIQ